MQIKRLTVLGLILGMLLLAGCGGKNADNGAKPGEDTAKSGAADKSPYKIGVLVAQTGASSWLGDGELKSAQMVAEQVNASGGVDGHQIEIVPYDSATNPEQAVKGASKLIEDGVLAIIGPSVTAECKAVSPLVKDQGPVVYTLSGGYRPENPYMFAASAVTGVMQQTVLDFLKTKGLTKIGMLAGTDASGQEAVDSIKELMAKDKSFQLVALERVNPTDVDVTVQLNNIKKANPDVMISWCTGKLIKVATKNFYQMGWHVPYIVNHGNLSYTFLEGIKDFAPKTLWMPATKDFAWTSLAANDPQKVPNEKLHNDYKAKFNKDVDFGPAVSYDAMNLIIEGLKQVGGDKAKLRDYLENVQNYAGATAVFNFNKDDHRGTSRKDTVVVQASNGKFELAK